MSTDDDDILTGSVPEPDAEPTAAERAHARTFGELLDKTLAGKAPPAISADDRALLEVATVIRATSGGLPLAPGKQRALIEDVLQQAIGGVAAPGGGSGASGATAAVVPIEHARARRWVPWAIAGATSLIAAAAVAMLVLREPPKQRPAGVATAPVPASWRSRSTDALIGPISRERSGDASARLDYIFADRLDGFRDRRLSRVTPGASRASGGRP